MNVQFELDGFVHGDGDLISVDISVEVTATIGAEEVWGFNCNTVTYDPYVEDVSFAVDLHIGSPEANLVYGRYLSAAYKHTSGFREEVNSLARCAYYEKEESEKVERQLMAREAS